ncbi:MAG: hypothetical protein KF732_00085 [Flavobacteriales bacterium]|jgi:hypothetical protein|nr:hypothetical protein [Flavobacteriales bacterium]MBV6483589.1 hypothetical protein [Flavobacteriales bacterium]MBX2958329.1 hypothetical protein [Flavobacteriales bacterium]MCL4856771.1 hypothetical protein [Flavobacteriales bacterium]HRN41768.1 hypothetical protein [Vicingus sp.]
MENLEGNKLIVKIQRDLAKSGIVKDNLVKDLKELRNFALAEQDPTLTKVIRLTYEHIEQTGTFSIPIPADEAVVEGEEPETMDMEDFDNKRESLNYLLSLMLDRKNPTNRQDLEEYRDMLKDF